MFLALQLVGPSEREIWNIFWMALAGFWLTVWFLIRMAQSGAENKSKLSLERQCSQASADFV